MKNPWSLVLLVVLGLGTCYAAYRHGPIKFKKKSVDAPPGWVTPDQPEAKPDQPEAKPDQPEAKPDQPEVKPVPCPPQFRYAPRFVQPCPVR